MEAKLTLSLLISPKKILRAVMYLSEADICSFYDVGICFCRRHRIGGGYLFINGVNEFDNPVYKLGSGAVIEYRTGSGKGYYSLFIESSKREANLIFKGRRNSFLRGSEVFTVYNWRVYIGNIPVAEVISGVVVTTTPECLLDNLPVSIDYIRP